MPFLAPRQKAGIRLGERERENIKNLPKSPNTHFSLRADRRVSNQLILIDKSIFHSSNGLGYLKLLKRLMLQLKIVFKCKSNAGQTVYIAKRSSFQANCICFKSFKSLIHLLKSKFCLIFQNGLFFISAQVSRFINCI